MVRLCKVGVSFLLVMSLLFCFPADSVNAASKKPAKVKGIKFTYNKTTEKGKLKISWQKAKRAKKYQVYYKKATSKKWRKKTTSKRSITLDITNKSKYQVKVRGVNGSKKGKFSEVRKTSKVWINPVKKYVETNQRDVQYEKSYIAFFLPVANQCFDSLGYLIKDGVWVTYTDANGIEQEIFVRAYFKSTAAANSFVETLPDLKSRLALSSVLGAPTGRTGLYVPIDGKLLTDFGYKWEWQIVEKGHWE